MASQIPYRISPKVVKVVGLLQVWRQLALHRQIQHMTLLVPIIELHPQISDARLEK